MWGIIPAAGNGTRIQPLAFSKELLPVGSRFEGGTERPRAVSEYLIERMLQGGADKICFVISPLEIRHPAILRRRDRQDGRRSPMRCSPSRAGLCDAIFRAVPFVDPGRTGAGRSARHDLAAGRRFRPAARRQARLPDLPGRAAGTVRRRGQRS